MPAKISMIRIIGNMVLQGVFREYKKNDLPVRMPRKIEFFGVLM